ncbi:MAG: hypothetical protein IID41_15520 [Planctomycetes bacterium]|nr:hypothetical protein [Planctomycetota bacterium]
MAFLIADFLLPTLLAIAILGLAWVLTGSTSMSVLATSAFIWFNWQDVLNLVHILSGDTPGGELFLRTPYPQFSELLFVLFLISILLLLRRQSRIVLIFFSLTLTANLYDYFYSWTLAMSIVFCWIVILATPQGRKFGAAGRDPRQLFLEVTGATAVAILLAAPVLLIILDSSATTLDLFERAGGKFSRAPEIKHGLFVVAVLLCAVSARRLPAENRLMWILFWSGLLIALNQQLFTGKLLQPFHYIGYYEQPFFLLFACDIAYHYLGVWNSKGRSRIKGAVVSRCAKIVLVVGVGQALFRLNAAAMAEVDHDMFSSELNEVTKMLNETAMRGYGFITNDPYLDSVLPVYVPQKPLDPLHTDALSNKMILDIRCGLAKIFGIETWDEIDRRPLARDCTKMRPSNVRFDPSRIVIVQNVHRKARASGILTKTVLRNRDFELLVLENSD